MLLAMLNPDLLNTKISIWDEMPHWYGAVTLLEYWKGLFIFGV